MTKNMPPQDPADSIQALLPKIEAILSRSGTPGLSFAVVHHGETIYVGHLGHRDVEAGLAPDNDTRYNINSLSKATIAALVGIEVRRGTLSWDNKIIDLLPEFKSTEQVVQEQATLRDVLSHRTGIISIDAPWLEGHNTILMDRSVILPYFATLKAVQPFRTSFLYNNWGYELTALILERVTGTPLHQLLHDRLFAPLGMLRTSTSWQTTDDNVAKSYGVLEDLTPVEVCRPQLGQGTLMEAAGGVKSTISDLIIWYKTWLQEIDTQCADVTNHGTSSILAECPTIVSAHAWLPGTSFREQTYAAGWARSQLPGQLGRLSQNAFIGDEPVVGRSTASRLVIYHHGSMPGSTSVVNLLPETKSAVIVLQNSLATIDTADFVGQMLVEALLKVPEPNDYLKLTEQFSHRTLHHLSDLKMELDRNRKSGSKPDSLQNYVGTYRNASNFFRIDIKEHDGHLQMCFQTRDDEIYKLTHYEDDTFSWLLTYNEAVSRGRYVNDYSAEFYLIRFCREESHITGLDWAWDANTTEHFSVKSD